MYFVQKWWDEHVGLAEKTQGAETLEVVDLLSLCGFVKEWVKNGENELCLW